MGQCPLTYLLYKYEKKTHEHSNGCREKENVTIEKLEFPY